MMIYFDIMPSLELLSDQEFGQLMRGILLYGLEGTEPDFRSHLHMEMVWKMIRPRLDKDRQHYEAIVNRRRYAAAVRWEREMEKEDAALQMDAPDAKGT